jgi:integral membrane protein
VKGALTRFRVMAVIVGVMLLLLTLVAMPLKYFGHNDIAVAWVAPAHGWLFVVYLGAVADLARRVQWSVSRILLVAVAGTIPFMSFIMERQVRTWVQLPEDVSTASAR